MAFKKIDKEETKELEGRQSILVYGFGAKDFKKLSSFATMLGIRDIIPIKEDMLDCKLINILEDDPTRIEGEEGPKETVIVFNAFPGKKLNAFISNYNITGLPRPLLATVTKTSISWSFRDLVKELQKERAAIAKGEQMTNENHKKED